MQVHRLRSSPRLADFSPVLIVVDQLDAILPHFISEFEGSVQALALVTRIERGVILEHTADETLNPDYGPQKRPSIRGYSTSLAGDRPAVLKLGLYQSPRAARRAAAQRVDCQHQLVTGLKRLG
jgi:hypothetical protein